MWTKTRIIGLVVLVYSVLGVLWFMARPPRRDLGPTEHDRREIAARIGGEYGLYDGRLSAGVYGMRGGLSYPTGDDVIHWQAPRLALEEGGRFSMKSFPPVWMPEVAIAGERELSITGTWQVRDDGDGSWVVALELARVNGRPRQKSLLMRTGEPMVLETSYGTIPFTRVGAQAGASGHEASPRAEASTRSGPVSDEPPASTNPR